MTGRVDIPDICLPSEQWRTAERILGLFGGYRVLRYAIGFKDTTYCGTSLYYYQVLVPCNEEGTMKSPRVLATLLGSRLSQFHRARRRAPPLRRARDLIHSPHRPRRQQTINDGFADFGRASPEGRLIGTDPELRQQLPQDLPKGDPVGGQQQHLLPLPGHSGHLARSRSEFAKVDGRICGQSNQLRGKL